MLAAPSGEKLNKRLPVIPSKEIIASPENPTRVSNAERNSPHFFPSPNNAAGNAPGNAPSPSTRTSRLRTCPMLFNRAITSWPR